MEKGLYIVATPIGNLEDMSFRAVRTLKEVDLIACEDTRHSRILLNHYEIKTPYTSFHSYTSDAKLSALALDLKNGKSIAIITDAGTPGISDPAWSLIKAAVSEGVKVIPIPGAAAFLTALMGAGLPLNDFSYLGFVPAKKGRQTFFELVKDSPRTAVFYESPHRLLKTLEQMNEIIGPLRACVLARELTKLHESFYRGTVADILALVKRSPIKGEMVLLVGPEGFSF
jgi:16S rRNA (cytidine1402-2'-O)-methyltransferase